MTAKKDKGPTLPERGKGPEKNAESLPDKNTENPAFQRKTGLRDETNRSYLNVEKRGKPRWARKGARLSTDVVCVAKTMAGPASPSLFCEYFYNPHPYTLQGMLDYNNMQ